ncbi:hypothetical protein DVK85_01340 [Flavobacterium arcticum]|uniref:Uncharacterized protein n=1 Tax=Flavobacterium arcticum TaxID=1784713 RepID=A0A345H8N6_9FLAO|nr:hypothetical protein [Flavobacterium arcticum]AXG72946.1 hypothetical protein DVK85_01340 [Flavobacterium arcticum]KAF2510390.1 hypothetical protein E0W72_07865 [Flavobacterium arcticum]
MINQYEYAVPFVVAAGSNGKIFPFKPEKNGIITGCAIFKEGGANTGMVTVEITTDTGEVISPESHISNYRDREAAYYDGKKPVHFESGGKTFHLKIRATEAFDTALVGQLVLVYAQDFTNKNC